MARGAADEVGWKTRMTWQAAGTRMARAARVTERHPKTLAVLRDGRIDPGYVTVVDDLTQILSGADVAEADRLLAAAAPGKTYGQLRAAAARLVNRLDPGAVQRRKEQMRQRDGALLTKVAPGSYLVKSDGIPVWELRDAEKKVRR